MCGIFGYVDFTGKYPIGPETLAAPDVLYHRGPDEGGSWHGDRVFLGMRRLSIIDLAGGQQPIWNEDKSCCIIYNGELYNFLDLRPTLEARGRSVSHTYRHRSGAPCL